MHAIRRHSVPIVCHLGVIPSACSLGVVTPSAYSLNIMKEISDATKERRRLSVQGREAYLGSKSIKNGNVSAVDSSFYTEKPNFSVIPRYVLCKKLCTIFFLNIKTNENKLNLYKNILKWPSHFPSKYFDA